MAATENVLDVYQFVFGDLVMHIDGVERRGAGWPDWQITSRIDTLTSWRTVWKAVCCHRTQLPAYHLLERLPEEQHKALWGCQTFYRAFSLVNGGRIIEHDLFEGLRYVPPDLLPGSLEVEQYLNALNAALLTRLQKSGKVFMSNAVIGGTFVLRACIVNFRTSLEDIEAIPGIVIRIAGEVDAALRPAKRKDLERNT